MINNVTIKNYKSVVDVSLPLGRFNLLIGANGCGKSNILEGIALGAAASSDKLDYEYFANRGIRVVDPKLMLPAFEDIESDAIQISVTDQVGNPAVFYIQYSRDLKPARWVNSLRYYTKVGENVSEDSSGSDEFVKLYLQLQERLGAKHPLFRLTAKDNMLIMSSANLELEPFIIYSLEESLLRKADDSNRIYPIGRHGEGLFAYLKELVHRPDSSEMFNEIKENLKILDWFDDMEVPSGQLSMEFNLRLKDSYFPDDLYSFDQRSTNEGFLYLLFYFTLVISDETPRFFAIENIDTAFNPKLCREVIKRLNLLAKKHDKQIIATTHNPAVLDGLDLSDDEQKLMVVQRSVDGYTKVRTLKNEQVANSDLPLSQLWLRGYIGGLPNNF